MDKSEELYIDALNGLWHRLIMMMHCSKCENQFPGLTSMTTIEVSIISLMSQKPEIIFREISETLDIPKSTLTSLIDRLEKRGYLKRVISNKDRRSYGLELTDEGKVVQQEHINFERLICSQIVETMDTKEEKQIMLKLVNKITYKLNSQLIKEEHHESN